MMRKYVPIICLDFDGVIHSYTSGWKGVRNVPDGPMAGAIEFIHTLLNNGFEVAIHSSRSGQWGGRRAMRNWLRGHAGNLWHEAPGYLGLEDVKFPLFKPAATVSIDDRALTFTGVWPSLQTLAEFKPWNKK